MDGNSLDIKQQKLDELKVIFPEVFTEGKVDLEKLKATLGEDIEFSNERYVLNWAGKSDAFKIMQAPTSKTLVPAKEESVNFDETQHIFIEGENLEVLKVLQKSYFGKIKMIYIDPPYNTGNDSFIYPDKFSETKEEYQRRIGDKDEEGYMTKEGLFRKNSRENGQYHSNWLNMMHPRLFLAKNLLKQDGVIFVSIDDHEVHNLRLLMNEIFGEDNVLGVFIWKRRQNADNRNQTNVSTDHEYILAYSKSSLALFQGKPVDASKYKNPDNDPRGPWASIDLSGLANAQQRPNLHFEIVDPKTGNRFPPNPKRGWSKSKANIQKMIEEGRILFPSKPSGRPREKKFYQNLTKSVTGFSTIFDSKTVGHTTNGTREVAQIFEDKFFDFPKPISLIETLIDQVANKDEIVLDFFAGSGTTAHALFCRNQIDGGNRRFICVQLPEPTKENGIAFGGGYRSIAELTKERILRAGKMISADNEEKIESIKKKIDKQKQQIDFDTNSKEIEDLGLQIEMLSKQDLGFKVLKLADSNFKQWRQHTSQDAETLAHQMEMFVDPVTENATTENMVYELILKSGKDLNSKITHEDKVYRVNETELVLLLEEASQGIVDTVLSIQPKKVIALDRLFEGNDQLKTNTALQMKDAGIEFKTI